MTRSAPPRARKRIAIVQSAYIPWRGFFDLIGRCDEYVLLDSVQFAKRHWHNRNRIKTPQGPSWITVPVTTKGRFEQSIDSVEISEPWAERHLKAVLSSYRRAPLHDAFAPLIADLYRQADGLRLLTEVNELFLRAFADLLGIRTAIVRDTAYGPEGHATDRLLDICLKAGATHYLSGPSARDYLDEEKFRAQGISVEWMAYEGYPPYPQLWGDFVSEVSVVDLILNAGVDDRRLWNTALASAGEHG